MSDSTESIAGLFRAIRDGDQAAQARILERFAPWLRLMARLQTGAAGQGKFDSSDIAQQTLLEACRGLPGFLGNTEPELLAWLRQILAHVLAHEVRRYRGTRRRDMAREVSLEQSLAQSSLRLGAMLADGGPSPSRQASAREQEVVLADVLARLPADYQEVIVLRNLQELPHEEVARRMGRSVGAVRMLWVRALAQLRAELLISSHGRSAL